MSLHALSLIKSYSACMEPNANSSDCILRCIVIYPVSMKVRNAVMGITKEYISRNGPYIGSQLAFLIQFEF